MKARYQRITVCGTHSNNVTGDEEVLAVDRLAVTCKWIWWKCRTERKQVVRRQSFGKLNVECIGSSSSTGCSCDGGWDTTIYSHLQSFERAFKKYSNCVPSLEDEMVEIVHKHPKKQHLANSDFANLYWPLLAVLRTKQQLKPRQQRTAKEMHS